ncbi:hypothetical protein Tco_1432438, partial [Tanacetum coccineum]
SYLVQVLQGVEFEVELQDDHTFEVEPQGNVSQGVGSQEIETRDLLYYYSARDRERHLTRELFKYREDSNEAAFEVVVVENIYAHVIDFNDTIACEVITKWKVRLKEDMDVQSDAEIWVTKGLLVKETGNVLGLEIIRGQSGNTLRGTVMWKRMVSGHIYVVGSLKYQVICTRPDIASTGEDMLDGFDHGLQKNLQVFVDFDYAMGRSITVMIRSITREVMEAKTVKVLKVGTEHNAANALTKVVPGLKLQHCLKLLNVGIG